MQQNDVTQRIADLLATGKVSEQDVYNATKHGTQDYRNQVAEGIRIARTMRLATDEEAVDMADLAALVADRAPMAADAQEAKKGHIPADVRRAGEQVAQTIPEMSVAELASSANPVLTANYVQGIMASRNAATVAGVRESARTRGDFSLNALEQQAMEQRQITALSEDKAAKMRAALEEGRTTVIDLEAITDPDDDSLIGEINSWFNSDTMPIGALALEAGPRGYYDSWRRLTAMQEADIAEKGFFNRMINSVFPYMSLVEAREELLKMTPEEARDAIIKMTDELKTSNNILGNNFSNMLLIDELISDEFINQLDPTADGGALLIGSFLWGVANVAEIAIGSKILGKLGVRAGANFVRNSPVGRRLLIAQNPERFLAGLRQEFKSPITVGMSGSNKINIAQTQLPSPGARASGDPIVNFPDGVASDETIHRLEDLTTSSLQMAQRTRAGMFDVPEQARIIDEVVEEIDAANVGRVRPGMSEIDVLDDMSGFEMRMMIGANDTGGFKSLDEAVEWAKHEAGTDAQVLEYFRVEADGTLVKHDPAFDVKGQPKNNEPGEYYVRVKYDHKFSPDDVRYFDETPVVTGNWFGTTFGVPSSFLDTSTVGKYVRSYLREQELTNLLDAMVAPLYKNLNRGERRTVNSMMSWAEDFGTREGRMPTLTELKEQFRHVHGTDKGPNAKEIEGFYTARHFQDTLYEIQNFRLRNNWDAQGFKTLRKAGQSTKYHGKPLQRSELDGETRSAYDPETGKTREFTSEELDQWFASGNSVIRLDVPISGSRGHRHRLVLVDKTQGYNLKRLDTHVLEYRPGYNTRIYEDAHFIHRVENKANIDGKVERHVSTVRVAATAKEARQFSERVIDAIGRRKLKGAWDKKLPMADKARILREKFGIEIEVANDARLSDADRIQIDLDKFRTEGRLFFDEKQPRPIKNTENKTAELVDPINVIQRTGRMVARQVATEDLVNAQKLLFKQKYGGLIKISRFDTSAEIDAELTRLIRTESDAKRARAIHARAWWRYIRFMEGTMNTKPSEFRRAAIRLGEWVDYNIGKRIGGRNYTKEFARKMGKVDLIQASKSLAFLHFLTARPIRQLVLQGMQHINLQALDLTYIGKWQLDTFSLMSAMKRLSRSQQDELVMGLKREQSKRLMGFDDEEMDIVLSEFSSSGLIPGVNVHSYAGGQPKGVNSLPRTALGGAAQTVGNALRKPIDIARSLGFDMGEQFNVTASWLMALRRTMKERGFKSVKQLTTKDWDDVANRGSQYALAMHKANAAPWQYGIVSLPLQFLQFTHKWLLTMLGANKTMRRIGLANQQFTQDEAMKILVGQTLMWGGAGFALKDPILAGFTQAEVWAEKTGNAALKNFLETLSPDAKDLIASGLVDWSIDELFRRMAEDEELDFAFDETFSPGMGLKMVIEKAFEWTGEPVSLAEIALGPSGTVYNKIGKALEYGAHIHGRGAEALTFGERAQMSIEVAAEGLLVGFSDYYKIEMARKMGQWTNSRGSPTGLEAKWEEMVMKGVLGINPQRLMDHWRVSGNVRDLKAKMRDDARNHAQVISTLFLKFKEGTLSEEQFLHWALGMSAGIELYADHGLEGLYRDEFLSAIASIQTADGTTLQKAIADLIMQGYTGDVVQDAINSGLFPKEYEPIARDFIEQQRRQEGHLNEDYARDTERTIENFGRMLDGKR